MLLGSAPLGGLPLGAAPQFIVHVVPLVQANGRWRVVSPIADQQTVAHYGMVHPTLSPLLNEVGFTFYFSYSGDGQHVDLVFTAPSGAQLQVDALLVYPVEVPFIGPEALYFGNTVAYVFNVGDLFETGLWSVYAVSRTGIPVSGRGYFNVMQP